MSSEQYFGDIQGREQVYSK